MIISNLVGGAPPVPERARPESRYPRVYSGYTKTKSGQRVTEDAAKKIATAYRCANTICNDIAQMPLQVFNSYRGNITRLYPDMQARNTAYLVERKPNRWMSPFLWKRTIVNWLIWWGNAYIWSPPIAFRELFILDASKTYPVFDADGNKWYQTIFPNGQNELIPDVEMVHLMLNSKDGLVGMSVLEYARETMGRQLAAHETQDELSGNGLKPTAALWVKAANLDQESKDIIRKTYLEAAETGAAIFEENKFSKFETITMKPTDAQFLEGVAVTDADIANFFDFPLHKLNMGKQSYESNEQQELAYVKSTLNPYLVQWEQAGAEKWIAAVDQPFQYLRFNRDALLQTDAKTRTEVLIKKVLNGILTPNQALQIEDM
ncbi:MAG: phage portal protein, partial [Anaerolineae bacterium]|nr:phage portal protein [Anaerolineae bacterium]